MTDFANLNPSKQVYPICVWVHSLFWVRIVVFVPFSPNFGQIMVAGRFFQSFNLFLFGWFCQSLNRLMLFLAGSVGVGQQPIIYIGAIGVISSSVKPRNSLGVYLFRVKFI